MTTAADDNWLKFSHLNKEHFTAQFSGFSLFSSFISHPLTVLSVRQQAGSVVTGDHFKKANVFNTIKQSYQTIGLRGLFRGWIPMAVFGTPSNLIYISTIEFSREYFQTQYRIAFPNMSSFSIDLLQAISSSIIANVLSIVPYVPGEVLSSRLIVQGKEGVGSREMTRIIYREEGVKGFFKGFSSSLLVGIVLSTQWWWTYSTCKRYSASLSCYEENALLCDGVSGLAAGLSAAAVAHPFDTIKTRIMTADGNTTAYKRFLPTLVETVRKEGVRRLFKGLSAGLYQAALGSSVFAFCYELIKKQSKHNNHEDNRDVSV